MADPRVRVKIEGDTKDLKQSLKNAESDVNQFKTQLDRIGKNTDFTALKSKIDLVKDAMKSVVGVAKELVGAYSQAETTTTRLKAVLNATGNSIGMTVDELKDFAGQIQDLTGISDEAVQSAEQVLIATQALDKEGLKRAIEDSADLAVAMGTDITSASQTLAMALQDPEAGLTRLRRSGIAFTDEEQNLIKSLAEAGKNAEAQALILDKVESKYKGVAKAVGDTNVGTLEKISQTWGDIKENLGGAILDAIQPALDALLIALKKVQEWMTMFGKYRTRKDIVSAVDNGGSLDSFTTNELEGALDYYKKKLEQAQNDFFFEDKDSLTKRFIEQFTENGILTVTEDAISDMVDDALKEYENIYYSALAEYQKLQPVADEISQRLNNAGNSTGAGGYASLITNPSEFIAKYNELLEAKNKAKKELDDFKKDYENVLIKDEFFEAQLSYLTKVSDEANKAFDAFMGKIEETETKTEPVISLYEQWVSELNDMENKAIELMDAIDEATIAGNTEAVNSFILALQELYDEIGKHKAKGYSNEPADITDIIQDISENPTSVLVPNKKNKDGGMNALARSMDTGVADSFFDLFNIFGGMTEVIDGMTVLTEKGEYWKDVMVTAFGAIGKGFEQLGEDLVEGKAGWGSFAKAGLEACASILESLGYQLASMAISTYPNFAQMALSATGSAMAFTGAGIVKGYAGRFETGGIVGGHGITGDRHMIFANAGELILNKAQQERIAGQLTGGGNSNAIAINFSGNVFGNPTEISEYVYDAVKNAQREGVIGAW